MNVKVLYKMLQIYDLKVLKFLNFSCKHLNGKNFDEVCEFSTWKPHQLVIYIGAPGDDTGKKKKQKDWRKCEQHPMNVEYKNPT